MRGNNTYLTSFGKSVFRKLVGSNCVLIQTGKVPEYYYCVDCVIEDAINCVRSMRLNNTLNVRMGCQMNSLMDSYQSSQCCPIFELNSLGNLDLARIGSSYPEALKCIRNHGCSNSRVYSQLLNECESVCPTPKYLDPRNGGPICLADFNNANRSIYSSITSINILLFVVLLLIIR